jgi:hypothetical protein
MPQLLVATTVKMYEFPAVRPVTVAEIGEAAHGLLGNVVQTTVAECEVRSVADDEVTVYETILATPPVSVGGSHVTVACPTPGTAVTVLAGPGA